MAKNKVARLLYRELLHFARRNRDVPWQLRTEDLRTCAPGFIQQLAANDTWPPTPTRIEPPASSTVSKTPRNSSWLSPLPSSSATSSSSSSSLQGSAAIIAASRWAFLQSKNLTTTTTTDAQEALNRGFEALRLLNTTYATSLEQAREARAEHLDRTGIAFKVGTVFIHKKFGYRGVVYGWERECQRDEAWIQQMQASPHSPHYSVLPDETDCIRLFGGIRLTKYVGEDNILPLEGVVPIVHRAIDHYFLGQSSTGQYIPTEKLRYEYPNDWTPSVVAESSARGVQGDAVEGDVAAAAELMRPARLDANLLLHAEQEDDAVVGGGSGTLSGGEEESSNHDDDDADGDERVEESTASTAKGEFSLKK